MSASGEELDFFYLNSVNSQLSLFPSYKIEEETQGPSADLLTSDGPLLFYKINPFLPLPLGFRTIILKTRTHVQWYTLSFIILIAATSSNANCRHFFCVQSRNIEWSYVDCGEIDTVGSGTDVTISISPIVASLRLELKWRLFWWNFPQLKINSVSENRRFTHIKFFFQLCILDNMKIYLNF